MLQEQTNAQRFARSHRQTMELKVYESGINAAGTVVYKLRRVQPTSDEQKLSADFILFRVQALAV